MTHFTFIDKPEALLQLAQELDRAEEIVLDLEADSFHRYHTRICLAQISLPNKSWIIDPLAEGFDHTVLTQVFQKHTLLLHGCDYDLRLMKSLWDFTPTKIFDTVIAARLLGHRAFGLGALVEAHFGVKLDKSKQRADWAQRPLSEEMLQYAVCDTAYLREMVETMRKELIAKGRLAWAEESCEQLIQITQEPSRPKEDPWRLSGHSALSERQLSLLKAVWYWRDEEAQQRNLPPFKVLPNDRLLEIARRFAGEKKLSQEDLPRMPRHLKSETLETLVELICQEAHRPPEEWPSHHRATRPKLPMPDSRLVDKLRIIRAQLAEELDLEETLLATKPLITSLALNSRESEEEIRAGTAMMEWQYALFLPHILGLKP